MTAPSLTPEASAAAMLDLFGQEDAIRLSFDRAAMFAVNAGDANQARHWLAVYRLLTGRGDADLAS